MFNFENLIALRPDTFLMLGILILHVIYFASRNYRENYRRLGYLSAALTLIIILYWVIYG